MKGAWRIRVPHHRENSLNTLRRFIGNALLLAVLLLSACGSALAGPSTPEVAPKVGLPAPDFQLRTPGGENCQLSDLRGQAVFINFWATNCPHCRGEMHAIQAIYSRYGDQGLMVLGINKGDSAIEAANFAQQLQLTFPLLLDRKGTVAKAYQVISVPTSFFIDREGVIRSTHIGEMFEDDMAVRVETVLADNVEKEQL